MDRLVVGVIVLFLTVVIGMAFLFAYEQNQYVGKLRKECDGLYGELLDRTYRSGKTTGHNYTCINKKAIIDLDVNND